MVEPIPLDFQQPFSIVKGFALLFLKCTELLRLPHAVETASSTPLAIFLTGQRMVLPR